MKRILFIAVFTAIISLSALSGESLAQSAVFEDEPLPEPVLARLKELKIAKEKKEHEELIARAKDLSIRTSKLEEKYKKEKRFTPKDRTEINKLRKLVKKIRIGLRAKTPRVVKTTYPANNATLFKALSTKSKALYKEILRKSRYSLSVKAINDSNSIAQILRILSKKKNQNQKKKKK